MISREAAIEAANTVLSFLKQNEAIDESALDVIMARYILQSPPIVPVEPVVVGRYASVDEMVADLSRKPVDDAVLRAFVEKLIRSARRLPIGSGGPFSELSDEATSELHDLLRPAGVGDDGEQAAWPWLGEMGFIEFTDELSRYRSGKNVIEITGGTTVTSFWLNDEPICDNPTRGHVRRLFAALGIAREA